jgi:nucleotide-binding universal stress UspA family protein
VRMRASEWVATSVDTNQGARTMAMSRSLAVPKAALLEKQAPVLLVLSATHRPDVALLRAGVLSTRLGTSLHVIGVMPPHTQNNVLFPQRNLPQGLAAMNEESTATKRLWRWCNRKLLRPLRPGDVAVHRGSLSRCAIESARQLEAQLLIIPDDDVTGGAEITRIVDAAGVPVLVSRYPQPANMIVAASDLSLERVPVLRQGVALGETVGASVLFLHNVVPVASMPVVRPGEGMPILPLWPFDETGLQEKQRARLRKAASDIGQDVEIEVLDATDTVDAILGVARKHGADVVIVGHRNKSWVGRMFGEHVAAGVVNRARRSVLVVPIVDGTSVRSRGRHR